MYVCVFGHRVARRSAKRGSWCWWWSIKACTIIVYKLQHRVMQAGNVCVRGWGVSKVVYMSRWAVCVHGKCSGLLADADERWGV